MPVKESQIPSSNGGVAGNAVAAPAAAKKKLMKDASTQKTSPPRRREGKDKKTVELSEAGAANWLRLRAAWLSSLGLAVLFAMRCELGLGPDIRVATGPKQESESVQYFNRPELANGSVYRSESRQELRLNILSTPPLETAFLVSLALCSAPSGLLVQAVGFQRGAQPTGWWLRWLPGSPSWLLGIAVLASCLLNLLLPAAAVAASATVANIAAATIRIVQAAVESVVLPALFAMWGRWAPGRMRARLGSAGSFCAAAAGAAVGVSLAGSVGVRQDADSAWSLAGVTCGLGLAGCLWAGAWLALSHRWTSEAADSRDNVDGVAAKPLRALRCALTSGPFAGLCLAYAALHWGLRLCALGTVPAQFYRQAFGVVGDDRIWPRLIAPLVAMAIATLVGGQLTDRLSSSGSLSVTSSRRLSVCLGLGCFAASLATLSAGAGWHGVDAATALLTLGLAGAGLAASGVAANQLDLAPVEAGLLAGLAAAAGHGMGVASHCVAHHVTRDRATPTEWRALLGAAAALQAVAAVLFGLLCSGERQAWATTLGDIGDVDVGQATTPGEFRRLVEEPVDELDKRSTKAADYNSISFEAPGEAACQSES